MKDESRHKRQVVKEWKSLSFSPPPLPLESCKGSTLACTS